jgi:hypothetical protein
MLVFGTIYAALPLLFWMDKEASVKMFIEFRLGMKKAKKVAKVAKSGESGENMVNG